MLLSMTGHGEASRRVDGLSVAVEVRTVNNRYFKLNFRANACQAALESLVENVVREQVRRGAAQVNLQVDRQSSPDDYVLDEIVLDSYRRQLDSAANRWPDAAAVPTAALLSMPGVVREKGVRDASVDDLWPVAKQALQGALDVLATARKAEGAAMETDLRTNAKQIAAIAEKVAARAPEVAVGYRGRLLERINPLLADLGAGITAGDVAREVALFVDRTDVSEELVRLRCHLTQFENLLNETESSGRKLDFLTQEMFREINTIGSKANDGPIAMLVIDAKAAIERIREMVQNVE